MATQKGIPPKRIAKCLRPWDIKWAKHRENGKVVKYHRVNEYLDMAVDESADHMEDTKKYPSKRDSNIFDCVTLCFHEVLTPEYLG